MSQLGGGVGVADHITIGKCVQIAARSGVMNDIPDGEKWGGSPARPFKQWFREVATLRSMGKVKRRKAEMISTERTRNLEAVDIEKLLSILPHRYPFY